MSLVTLRTLKALKILTDLKALKADFLPDVKANSTNDIMTITPSKQFIVSLTYSITPIPISFNPISAVNIIVKIKLNSSNKA